MRAEREVIVHRFEASFSPVNAYLVETGTSPLVALGHDVKMDSIADAPDLSGVTIRALQEGATDA
jgi:hypothetical protein